MLNTRYVEKQLIYLRGSYLVMKEFVLPLYQQSLQCLCTDHQRLTSHILQHCILSNHNLKKHKISSNYSVQLHPTDQKNDLQSRSATVSYHFGLLYGKGNSQCRLDDLTCKRKNRSLPFSPSNFFSKTSTSFKIRFLK